MPKKFGAKSSADEVLAGVDLKGKREQSEEWINAVS